MGRSPDAGLFGSSHPGIRMSGVLVSVGFASLCGLFVAGLVLDGLTSASALQTANLAPNSYSAESAAETAIVSTPELAGAPIDELVSQAEYIFRGKVQSVVDKQKHFPLPSGSLEVAVREFVFDDVKFLKPVGTATSGLTITTDRTANISAELGEEVIWYVSPKASGEPWSFQAPINASDGDFRVRKDVNGQTLVRRVSGNSGLWGSGSLWSEADADHAREQEDARALLMSHYASTVRSAEQVLDLAKRPCCPEDLPIEFLLSVTEAKVRSLSLHSRRR